MASSKRLTYSGDVRSIVGDKFHCEYFTRKGFDSVRTWVATDATFDPDTNKTVVEFDELG